MKTPSHIYAIIIGSEILERRRVDQHFDYLSLGLATKGSTLFASLTIKDDATLITQTLKMIKQDPHAIIFCFGGIGSTPDDLTRQLACEVFSDGKLQRHPKFEKDIIERLGEKAYPHPITMSDLPKEAKLLFNPINNMSGFQLQDRYFFMPGFPNMAQPMMDAIIKDFIPQAPKKYTQSFTAQCGESLLISLMQELPEDIELSCLPMMKDNQAYVEITLSSYDKAQVTKSTAPFLTYLDTLGINYNIF